MRVTAALIVRDEADFIEGCLSSLAGAVDEIVLVDTGSTDDTIDKAQRFPIKLHHFKWVEDFSAVNPAAGPCSSASVVAERCWSPVDAPAPSALHASR